MSHRTVELAKETPHGVDEETLRAARSTRPGAWKERERAQRKLLIGAMAKAVATKGYAAVSVTDVLVFSQLSRMTFYKHFEGKEECFLAAFDAISEQAIGAVSEALTSQDSATKRAQAALGEVAELFAAEPELAHLAMVETRAAGRVGAERYQQAMERAVEAVEGHGEANGMASLIVGAVAARSADEVAAGRAAGLGELLPELLFVALTPCMGPEVASEEMRRWRKERERISAVGGGVEGRISAGDVLLDAPGDESTPANLHSNSDPTPDGRDPATTGSPPFQTEAQMARRANSPQEAIEALVEVVRAAASAEPELAGQVEAGMRALLGILADDPELAEAALAVGETEGRDYWPYREALAGFVPLLERAVVKSGEGVEPLPSAARAVVAGIAAVIFREIDEGRREELPALLPELVFLALNPLAGPEVAEEAMRRCKRG